jgi:hypothetical protein
MFWPVLVLLVHYLVLLVLLLVVHWVVKQRLV